MPFDANGTFTRLRGNDSWKGDQTAGTKVKADLHDTNDNDLANALSECLNRSGKGTPTANISWGGFKITNMAEPVANTDVATKNYVDTIAGWATAKYLSGADLNGRLNFTAASGVNGITWTYADMSFVARHSKASETLNRLVVNNAVAPSTTTNAGDVFFIDEVGRMGCSGVLMQNLSYDGAAYRTISPGYGSLLNYAGGDFSLMSNDVASITNPYVAVTIRTFFQALNSGGSTVVTLIKSATGKANYIYGQTGTELRWRMAFGDSAAESGTRTGSNFSLYAYDNAGANPVLALSIDRGTGRATLNGDVTVTGALTTDSYLYSSDTSLILQPAANGQVLIRADGTDINHQAVFDAVGSLRLCNLVAAAGGGLYAGAGVRGKAGQSGAYGSSWLNFNWNGSNLVAYTGNASLGNVSVSCDYRIKKDVTPLASMWAKVKALLPISYTQQAYEVWTEDDLERWGFIAHELQETLTPSAASGVKDGPDVQGPNPMVILAAVTRALQEAMERIEALEAAK